MQLSEAAVFEKGYAGTPDRSESRSSVIERSKVGLAHAATRVATRQQVGLPLQIFDYFSDI